MGKVYLAADCNFFDEVAAQRNGNSTVEEFNSFIVKSINSTVTLEDDIIFLGNITQGSFEENKELFEKINGKKYIIDSERQTQFTEEEWKEIGFTHFWNNNGAQRCVIDGKESIVTIEAVEELYKLDKLNKELYLAAPASLSGQKDRYSNKQLNISMEQWGYFPIEIRERLPQMIDDMELFNKMED